MLTKNNPLFFTDKIGDTYKCILFEDKTLTYIYISIVIYTNGLLSNKRADFVRPIINNLIIWGPYSFDETWLGSNLASQDAMEYIDRIVKLRVFS